MPEGRIHIDQALTNLSVEYTNSEFVAEQVAPIVTVGKQSGLYFVRGKDAFTVRDDRRSPGSEARRTRWTLSDVPYWCGGHALKDYVPREDQNNADPQLDLLADTTEVLTEQILLNQEVNLVTGLAAAMSAVDVVAAKWNVDTNDPIAAILAQRDTIIKNIGKRPNRVLFSAPVWTAVQNNALVKGALSDSKTRKASPADVAEMLEVDQVIVALATKNTANEGQTPSMNFVWQDFALFYYVPQNPGRKTIALTYTFRWDQAFQQMEDGQLSGGQFVSRYYWRPNLSDCVEVHKYYDQRMIDATAGALFINTI